MGWKMVPLKTGAEIFWELLFFILGIIFFSMVSIGGGDVFDGGRAVPAEEVGLKKKQLEGGWGGGRSASPPDAFAEHATWFASGA